MENLLFIVIPLAVLVSWVSFGIFEAEGGVEAIEKIKYPLIRKLFWVYLHGESGRKRIFENEGVRVIIFPLLCISFYAQSVSKSQLSALIYTACGALWLFIVFIFTF